jgi:pentatricopeptide repeat protein
MAIAYGNMGYRFERRENLKKAMELNHRISIREKHLIEGDYYSDMDKQRAIMAYEDLLTIYPYDVTANINLGMLYNGIRELKKAIRCYKNAIIGDPSQVISYMNSAWSYTELAQYDSVRYILEQYKNNFEDNEIIRAYYSELHLYKHEYDLALIEIDKALDFKPADYNNFELKGDIYLCMAQFDSAKKIYRQLLNWDEEVAHMRARRSLWALALLQGKTKEIKKDVEAGLKLSRELSEMGWVCSFLFYDAENEKVFGNFQKALEIYENIISIARENNLDWLHHWALHYKADMFSKLNRLEEAKQIAKKLRKINLGDLNRWWNGNYLFLYGKIAMAEGNFGEAVDSLIRAMDVLTPNPESITKAYIYYSLAQAYSKNGNPDEAIEWYNKLLNLTMGRIRTGHIYAKSFYFLAKIYQKKGWEEKAIEHFVKFLDLWQEADYPFLEIVDARKQLAILQNR